MQEGLSGFAGIHGVKNFCIFAMRRFVLCHELLAETQAELACARKVMVRRLKRKKRSRQTGYYEALPFLFIKDGKS